MNVSEVTVFRKGIKENPTYLGFYHHPINHHMVIDVEGRVIDISSNLCLVPFISFFGYPQVRCRGKDYLLHRLVGETFLKCPGNRKEMILNHLDGNKFNPKLSNLEWTDYSGNVLHAFQSGLRTDNKPIEVLNLKTGAIKTEFSLNQVARNFGVNQSTISKYMASARTAPFMDMYSMRWANEDYTHLTKAHIGKHRNGLCKDVVASDFKNKIKFIFSSVGQVAKYFNVKPGLLYSYLNGGGVKSLDKYDIDVCYAVDYKQDKSILKRVATEPHKCGTPRRKPLKVKVSNVLTNEVVIWDSAEAFANEHNVKRNTLQKNINQYGRWKYYVFEYLKTV